MNRFRAAIAALILLMSLANAANVHGTAFNWLSLEAEKNIIFTVNTSPEQKIVSESGDYSFNLSNGAYSIMAAKLDNGTVTRIAVHNITISDNGSYTLDVVLVPLEFFSYLHDNATEIQEQLLGTETGNDTAQETTMTMKENAISTTALPTEWILLAVAALAIALTVALWRTRKGKEAPHQTLAEKNKNETDSGKETMRNETDSTSNRQDIKVLPEDLASVIAIIKEEGGRISQRELRTRLPHSEAKVSLMLAELEHEGLIKKFKAGRGNVIVLK